MAQATFPLLLDFSRGPIVHGSIKAARDGIGARIGY